MFPEFSSKSKNKNKSEEAHAATNLPHQPEENCFFYVLLAPFVEKNIKRASQITHPAAVQLLGFMKLDLSV